MQRFLFRFLLSLGLGWMVLSAGCIHYDIPRTVMHAPHTQIWGVALLKSHPNYRVSSFTRMNGDAALSEKPTVLIASGSDGNWQWVVKAVPYVVPEWKAWLADKKTVKIRREDERSGNWAHSASGWRFAFQRAHRVARYLLGRQPPALHATLLLVPDGVSYRRRVTRNGTSFFPLTLTFYWPSSGRLKQFTALTKAVTRTIYEYQHLLVDSKTIAPVGKSKGNRETNDEARSQCWFDSTFLALSAGTPSTLQWNLPQARAGIARLERGADKVGSGEEKTGGAVERTPKRIPFSHALLWGGFLTTESLVHYLQQRGVSNDMVVANKPAEMNAVMSVCRAMTQHPFDITATDGYPPSKVQYVPFFPMNLKAPRAAAASGEK